MLYVEIGLFLIGAGLLALGYRRNQRDILVAAALVMFVSSMAGDFLDGFNEGYASAPIPAPAVKVS
jgi:hypothetical protein